MKGAQIMANGSIGELPSSVQIAGAGDFNYDGSSDILMRSSDGLATIWDMQGLTVSSQTPVAPAGSDWAIATHNYDFV
jgi:hypothetical protein